jgi:hypothetical protein
VVRGAASPAVTRGGTDLHHIVRWHHGGKTSMDNLIPYADYAEFRII